VPLLDQYPRIIEIMEEGDIDACIAMEPNLSIGEEKGLLDVWAAGFDEAYLPHFQWEVRVARIELMENDPELVAAVMRGCQRSAHYAASHVDEWVVFVARQFGISERAAQRSARSIVKCRTSTLIAKSRCRGCKSPSTCNISSVGSTGQ
jgi:ABC-type nitrate/sulfonate/bicarbonate transport system substrate-binding protein